MQGDTWLRDLVAASLVNECAHCDEEVRRWAQFMGIEEGLACWEAWLPCAHRRRPAASPTRPMPRNQPRRGVGLQICAPPYSLPPASAKARVSELLLH